MEDNPNGVGGGRAGNGDTTSAIQAPPIGQAPVSSATDEGDPGAGVGGIATSTAGGNDAEGLAPTSARDVVASSGVAQSSPSSNLTPATSTASSDSQETSTSPINTSDAGSSGLSTGAKAGIAVGIVVVVLALLGGLFLWWRRRKQKAIKQGRGDDSNIPELDGTKKTQVLDSRMLPAELTGSSGPPPAELAGQNTLPKTLDANDFKELKMENDPLFVTAELPEKSAPSSSPLSDPQNGAARYEMDSNQQPRSPPPPIIRKQIPEPVHDPQSPISISPISPDTQVAPIPDTSTEPIFPPLSEAVSLPSPSIANGSVETQEMLMEEYARLEARRQRILELKKIEEEQEALQAKLKKMSVKDAK